MPVFESSPRPGSVKRNICSANWSRIATPSSGVLPISVEAGRGRADARAGGVVDLEARAARSPSSTPKCA